MVSYICFASRDIKLVRFYKDLFLYVLGNQPKCGSSVCHSDAKCQRGQCVCKKGFTGDGVNSCMGKGKSPQTVQYCDAILFFFDPM
jgi:hypothetical protein